MKKLFDIFLTVSLLVGLRLPAQQVAGLTITNNIPSGAYSPIYVPDPTAPYGFTTRCTLAHSGEITLGSGAVVNSSGNYYLPPGVVASVLATNGQQINIDGSGIISNVTLANSSYLYVHCYSFNPSNAVLKMCVPPFTISSTCAVDCVYGVLSDSDHNNYYQDNSTNAPSTVTIRASSILGIGDWFPRVYGSNTNGYSTILNLSAPLAVSLLDDNNAGYDNFCPGQNSKFCFQQLDKGIDWEVDQSTLVGAIHPNTNGIIYDVSYTFTSSALDIQDKYAGLLIIPGMLYESDNYQGVIGSLAPNNYMGVVYSSFLEELVNGVGVKTQITNVVGVAVGDGSGLTNIPPASIVGGWSGIVTNWQGTVRSNREYYAHGIVTNVSYP